ncbi:hypothetical protein [Bacillus cereus]|uniref:hypothetical protein n=1 Tax=Bacillus cereus TaxID=1396 RepID=UPI001124F40B|nr:hypothetical protein [Bacillus cereus]
MTTNYVEESNGTNDYIYKFIRYINDKTGRQHRFYERNMQIIDEDEFVIYDCYGADADSYFICAYTLLKRRRWEYIYLAATFNDASSFLFYSQPISVYLNETDDLISKHSLEVLRGLADELNELLIFLETYYECHLVGPFATAYIVLDTFSLKMRWSINNDGGWRFHMYTTRQEYYKEVDVSKENLFLNLKNILDDFINKIELIYIFQAEKNKINLKYPSLCSLLSKKFYLIEKEQEKFLNIIEKKTALSPLELELEIANSETQFLTPQSLYLSFFSPILMADTYGTYDFTTKGGTQKRIYFKKEKDSIYQFVKCKK